MTIKRMGFCCKWIDRADQVDGIAATDDAKKYNTGATTITWLNRQHRAVAEEKLWDLMKQNIESTRMLVRRVSELEPELRMVRISSDILQAYTEPSWRSFYHTPDVRAYAERNFAKIGEIAREHGVRLSFHPGQFCVLASHRPDVVERSIEEFEYHADMARWMGYGKTFQDFKINVHISGKLGPEGIRSVYHRLSPEARNCITIENEEITHGLDLCLTIADIVPIVLDIHHHWIREGEYIEASDVRIARIIDSWRGIRPAIHYSVSREEHLVAHALNQRPARDALIAEGLNKQKLRAHSNFYWNSAVNDWALTHWSWADIQCESKAKNLASFALHKYAHV